MVKPTDLRRRVANKLYQKFHPDEPWLAPKSIRFLDHTLSDTWHGVEWGSGASTAWFARRLRRLVSIEHDPHWFQEVRIRTAAMSNVDLRCIPLDHPPEETGSAQYDPAPKYVAVLAEFDDESFDFVLVDGAYRLACIAAALPKLRPGALLVVDNTNWLPLSEWGVPQSWAISHQSQNLVTQTTIWTKP